MSLEEIQARHRKELKALDGEKRTELKKTKSTAGKGKKAKEKLAEVEAEYDKKLKDLQENHAKEIAEFSSSPDAPASEKTDGQSPAAAEEKNGADDQVANQTDQEEAKERKLEKARRKREKQREKERERELQIERENAEAGPSLRDIEVEQIEQQLAPMGLEISEVTPDGNCLYRAVASHCGNTYQDVRNLCADTLLANENEFAPFCEYEDKAADFPAYVDRVRNSSDWGGHLELRALSLALHKDIVVYSAQSKDPLIMKPDGAGSDHDADPICLSYHLHYYALGEHYNQVVKAATD